MDDTVRQPGARSQRRLLGGILAAVLLLSLIGVARPTALHAARPATTGFEGVLTFLTMVGNSGPYLGTAGALRGIPAGGAPWRITSARGFLLAGGTLIVNVHGLTLLNGFNPVPQFEAAVSCQSIGLLGQETVTNVFTQAFPATVTGDSVIDAHVALPTPCFAPLVLVTSPAPQHWFAVTGV
jgi:hypothetical protein